MAPVESSHNLRRPTRRGNAPAASKPPTSKSRFDIPDDELGADSPKAQQKSEPVTKVVKRGRPLKKRWIRGKHIHAAKEKRSSPMRQQKEAQPEPQVEDSTDPPVGEVDAEDDSASANDNSVPEESEAQVKVPVNGTAGNNEVTDGGEGAGNEDESESEVVDEDEDEEPWDEDDLHGQSRLWNKILKEKRRLENKLHEHPDLVIRTATIGKLHKATRKAQKCYQQILKEGSTESVTEVLRIRCEVLKAKLLSIEENSMRGNEGAAACDLYAFAIPEMIELTSLAFQARLRPFPGKDSIVELEEVITILEMAVTLCKKARNWKTAPNPNPSLVRHTQRVFLPELRSILEHFEDVHKSIVAENQAEQDEAHRMERYEQEAQHREEESRERWVLIKERRAAIRRDLERRPFVYHSQRPRSRTPTVPSTQIPPTSSKDEWTADQEDEMMLKLSQIDDVDLETRYTACLTCPSLQNKLPQHIEKRAMELKPDMIRFYEERDEEEPDIEKRQGVPYWVTSLGHCIMNGAI